jgi:hypothetical protein
MNEVYKSRLASNFINNHEQRATMVKKGGKIGGKSPDESVELGARPDRLEDRYRNFCFVCYKPLIDLKCSGCKKEPSLCSCNIKVDRLSDREQDKVDVVIDKGSDVTGARIDRLG